MKRVSIIIPAYNAERYVREAVESALTQTYPNCEVVVVDDGSTDGTRKALEPYISNVVIARSSDAFGRSDEAILQDRHVPMAIGTRDDKGKIIYIHQANKGLAGARNAGVRAAKGEHIAFLDADDLFLPEKIARQVMALEERTEYGVCYCDLIHFTGENPRTYFHHRYTYPSGNIFEPLLHKQFLNPLTFLVRREVFEKYGYFDETFRRSEDWDLWLRWAHAGVLFYYLDVPLAHYRVHTGGGNLSSLASEPQMKEKNLEIFSRLFTSLTPEERARYGTDAILRRVRLKTAFAYLVVGKKKEALAKLEGMPAYWRVLVWVLPAGAWRFILSRTRAVKHRLLLKKL